MKIYSLALGFFAIRLAQACEYDMPAIALAVQTSEVNGVPETAEVFLPLYTGCDYRFLGAAVQASGSLATALSGSFPVDNYGFSSATTHLALDSNSQQAFFTHLGQSYDTNNAMNLVQCIVTDTSGQAYNFDATSYEEPEVFNNGMPIQVASYNCFIPEEEPL